MKYKKKVLVGRLAERLLFSSRPTIMLSRFVNSLKSVTSRKLRREFPEVMKRELWGGKFWSPSYFIATTGQVKLEDVKRYVQSQGKSQDALRRVDKAFQKFFQNLKRKKKGEKVKAGYPKKKPTAKYKSLTFPQVWMKQKGELVPKTGKLKIKLHRNIDWEKAKTATVKREPSGNWYYV